jgi:hypothetical protein
MGSRDGSGFGTGWGGAVGFGGAVSPTNLPVIESETLTLGEGLDVWVPLWVRAASPNSPFIVTIEFSHPLDPGYAPNFDPTNYSTLPALTILSAAPGGLANEVRIETSEQGPVVYTLVVNDGRSVPGDPLDPTRNTTLFAGFVVSPNYYATAQSREKVMLTFSTELLINASVTDPASYTITDLEGSSYTVDSATVNAAPSGNYFVTLELGTDLAPLGYYVCTISSFVKAATGLPYSPDTDVFQYIERDLNLAFEIPISTFSGEIGEQYPFSSPGENLLQYPEDFTPSWWSKTSSSIDPQATSDPFGEGGPADVLVESDFPNYAIQHEITQTINPVGGDRITQSIFAKPLGRYILTMRSSGTPWGTAWFDLRNNEVTTDGWLNVVTSIEDLGNGWYHCSATYDRTRTFISFFFGVSEAVGEFQYIGSGIEAMGIYGAEAYNPSLLGEPLGQVFFSPALDTAVAADSTIQVDSVSVCTRAYDVYEIPEIPDPKPLMTWGPGSTYNSSVLNDTDNVLQATAERMGLPRINLSNHPEDTWGGAVDGPADAELVETIDKTRAAFLNVPAYRMFPATSSLPGDSTALLFDGVNEYVTMGNVLGSIFEYNVAFSVSFWLKTSTLAADRTFVSKTEGATTFRGFEVYVPSGGNHVWFQLTNDDATLDYVRIRTTVGGWLDEQWHHVVVTKTTGFSAGSGDFHIYVDGADQTLTIIRDSLTGTSATANALMAAARDVAGSERYFDGNLDDVAVYDRELTAGEVSWIYGGGVPPDLTDVSAPGDLVGYWRMGDGATSPTIPDDSTNSNDGTMTNMDATNFVGGAPLLVFRTADNLTPIGPGPTVNINLQP